MTPTMTLSQYLPTTPPLPTATAPLTSSITEPPTLAAPDQYPLVSFPPFLCPLCSATLNIYHNKNDRKAGQQPERRVTLFIPDRLRCLSFVKFQSPSHPPSLSLVACLAYYYHVLISIIIIIIIMHKIRTQAQITFAYTFFHHITTRRCVTQHSSISSRRQGSAVWFRGALRRHASSYRSVRTATGSSHP